MFLKTDDMTDVTAIITMTTDNIFFSSTKYNAIVVFGVK